MRREICTDCRIIQDARHNNYEPCQVCGSDAIEPVSESGVSKEIAGIVDANPRLDESVVFEIGDELHSEDRIHEIQDINPREDRDGYWLVVGEGRANHWFVGSIAVSVGGDDGSYELVKASERDGC